jgi:catechol 2,3-dioxygenase-like lactoylglutathione lyase family enzyme
MTNEGQFCSPVLRTGINVRDLDRSIKFYGDLLGFREIYSMGEAQSDLVTSMQNRPAGSFIKFVYLKQPGPNIGMIGLYEFSPAPPVLARRPDTASNGDITMFFYHDRFDWLLENLAAYGGKVLRETTVMSTPKLESWRQVMIADPDDVRLGIMERDPQHAYKTDGLGQTLGGAAGLPG